MEFISSLQNATDDLKPSLFELLSEQQLANLVPPSLRYLLTLATHRNPRYLLRVLNSYDEIYALLMLAVERHFLRTYGGSFTENFYGLKRERVLRIKGGEVPRAQIGAPELVRDSLKLKSADIWRNLLVLVGIPYLKRKLDDSFEIYGATQAAVIQMGPNYRREELSPDATVKQRLFWYYKWFLRKVYPSVNAAYYFSLLAFNLAYLFDNTKYSSPFLWLIGTRIRRLSDADYRAIALASEGLAKKEAKVGARSLQTSSIFNPASLSRMVLPQLLSSLKLLLPASIFALKFLEWWHASDFARQLSKKATEGIDLPPPIVSGLSDQFRDSSRTSNFRDESLKSISKLQSNTVALFSPVSNTATPSPPPTSTPPTSQTDTPPPRQASSKPKAPISSITHLPIHTVAAPNPSTSALCPICRHPIQTPTSAQTGFVFCYTCIFRWVEGTHERQIAFMEGRKAGDWDDEDEEDDADKEGAEPEGASREGKWESGKGRCAVTGRRVLGGSDGLRRVMA